MSGLYDRELAALADALLAEEPPPSSHDGQALRESSRSARAHAVARWVERAASALPADHPLHLA